MTPVVHDDKISRHSKKEKENEPEGFRHDLSMIQGIVRRGILKMSPVGFDVHCWW